MSCAPDTSLQVPKFESASSCSGETRQAFRTSMPGPKACSILAGKYHDAPTVLPSGGLSHPCAHGVTQCMACCYGMSWEHRLQNFVSPQHLSCKISGDSSETPSEEQANTKRQCAHHVRDFRWQIQKIQENCGEASKIHSEGLMQIGCLMAMRESVICITAICIAAVVSWTKSSTSLNRSDRLLFM